MPIYSGGLGVLAGDHLKSASDLGIPLIGIGLLYAQGYFRQTLDANGWQQEHYLNANPELLPIESVARPRRPAAAGRDRDGHAACCTRGSGGWRSGGPRCCCSTPTCRRTPSRTASLTARLYGGDARVRIRQELLLGVGGVRALHALGIHPSVLHLNEGHSAFADAGDDPLGMEASGLPFGEAVRDVAAMTVFTTHTPVAAGHDRFPAPLVEEHLGKIREALHLSYEDFMGLGRVYPADPNEPFCMTVLALKLSRHANGVSALHGQVSRRMWQPLYRQPARGGRADRPHHQRGPRPELGRARRCTCCSTGTWAPTGCGSSGCPRPGSGDRDDRGRRAVGDAAGPQGPADQLRPQPAGDPGPAPRGDATRSSSDRMEALDLNALTIGFARRFATYKRAGLVLQDVERLVEMVSSADRPIQFIFGGKAHPEDRIGKELIQNIVRLTRQERFAHTDRLRRGLRHERRPAARPGRRRLAEQPATAAGGQRHLRREGAPQRRPELLDPRRLVGRGV